MAGVVYVLTNPAMPGLIKIGLSELPIEQRLRQLDTTSLPLPFECFCAVEVENPYEVERSLHLAFADHRIRPSREFFRLSPDKPFAILKLLERRNVTPVIDVVETQADQVALDAERRRRSRFRFSEFGIGVGTVLTSVFDDQITCVVTDDQFVQFREGRHSLTSAALAVAHEKGLAWKAIQGPRYWLLHGKSLADIRDEMQNGEEDID